MFIVVVKTGCGGNDIVLGFFIFYFLDCFSFKNICSLILLLIDFLWFNTGQWKKSF